MHHHIIPHSESPTLPLWLAQQALAFIRCQNIHMQSIFYLIHLTPSGFSSSNDCISSLQWPQLPLTSWQSRKVQIVSESLGPHPLHWGIQLGTGSTIVVAVWMFVVAAQTTTYSLVFRTKLTTTYPLWPYHNTCPVIVWNTQHHFNK